MYWENTATLLLADLHLSKETHFRKNGIAVPDGITKNNLERLTALCNFFSPKNIIAIGDLFHSSENASLALFKQWKQTYPQIQFQLISGNHDILEARVYQNLDIDVIGASFTQNQICLTHHPEEDTNGHYVICGHVHPAIRLTGMAKQSLRLPCFWFGERLGVLPAFGGFTGMKTIHAAQTDAVFAIAENKIVRIQ